MGWGGGGEGQVSRAGRTHFDDDITILASPMGAGVVIIGRVMGRGGNSLEELVRRKLGEGSWTFPYNRPATADRVRKIVEKLRERLKGVGFPCCPSNPIQPNPAQPSGPTAHINT